MSSLDCAPTCAQLNYLTRKARQIHHAGSERRLGSTKDDPSILAQLKDFDGSDPSKPIHVSINGTIFNVCDIYDSRKSYNIFEGNDGSKKFGGQV
ncbi:hypothetical protein B0H19DRAFT_1247591 [Mycena capillaripes]|nr:hypothetical protein B0H19DRAFT_1247591 [Mycena capillaripes]